VPTYLQDVVVSHGFASQATSSSIPIVAYGVVLIVVMLVFPRGIQGGLVSLAGPFIRRGDDSAPVETSWRRRSPAADRKEKGRR
jgi:hypothetical protein